MKKFFSIIAIVIVASTVRAQAPIKPPYGYNGRPMLIDSSLSDDSRTALVFYNGAYITVDCVNSNSSDNVGMGILLRPRTRPGAWYPTAYGFIDDGLTEPTEEFMTSTVFYVKVIWLSQNMRYAKLESAKMRWLSGPSHNNASWYTPGTFNVIPGLVCTVNIEYAGGYKITD